MEKINNLTTYNDGMRKSMADKLFFLDVMKEKPELLVDYGCADGTLLQLIKEAHPEIELYGIDMNTDMLHLVEKNVGISPSHLFCSTFPHRIEGMSKKGSSAINLSSVLHEVYSYCTAEQEHTFWHNLNTLGYDYIIIRDMVWNESGYLKAGSADEEKLFRYADEKQLADFSAIWGDLSLCKNLYHFLLKYRYIKNWKREVAENYLGYSTDAIINNLSSNYSVVYRKDYILPFLYDTVKKDFEIELKNTTHTQLILKRR
jgi:cytochrome b involved in lipid metabolism